MLRLNLIGKQRCYKCLELQDLSGFSFLKRTGSRDRLCKKCHRVFGRASYVKYRDAIRVKAKTRRQRDKDKIRAVNMQWRKDNPDKVLAYERGRYARDPSKFRRASNRWAVKNPDKVAANYARYQTRLQSAPGGPFTLERYAGRIAMYGGQCAYCLVRSAETLDHAIAVSRGGSNWPANIYPACRSCNSSKGARTLYAEWVPKTRR